MSSSWRRSEPRRWLIVPLLVLSASAACSSHPLRVHPDNPRYFTDGTTNEDGSPKAVYLAGSHTWANLVDRGPGDPPPVFGHYECHDGWPGNPFNARNNRNGINGDPSGDGIGVETHALAIPGLTRLQEAYVRRVIDTVNDLDNVLYEIANEADEASVEWQNHLTDETSTSGGSITGGAKLALRPPFEGEALLHLKTNRRRDQS